MPRETGSTKSAKSETLLVLFCCAPRSETIVSPYGVYPTIPFAYFALLLFFQRHLNENFPYHSFIAISTHCWDKIFCPLIPDCPTPVVSAIRTHSQGGTYEKETDRTDVIHVDDCCAGFRMQLYSGNRCRIHCSGNCPGNCSGSRNR